MSTLETRLHMTNLTKSGKSSRIPQNSDLVKFVMCTLVSSDPIVSISNVMCTLETRVYITNLTTSGKSSRTSKNSDLVKFDVYPGFQLPYCKYIKRHAYPASQSTHGKLNQTLKTNVLTKGGFQISISKMFDF